MKADERLETPARDALRRAIGEAGGNEVFCIGELGPQGLVGMIRTVARGDRTSVPALRPYLEQSDVVIHNHPSGDLTPSGADLRIASEVGNEGIGFFIVDNGVQNVYAVAEPVPLRERVDLDCDLLAGLIEVDGRLSEIFPEYEERPAQIDMLRMVCRGFNGDTLCVVEAGTGVGKSLAYLIPAVEWAARNRERVVVSTATINLQQQLLDNDIPLVLRLLGSDAKAVLAKGRGNYLCRARLEESLEELALLEESDEELAAIRSWAESTETGSVSELAFVPTAEVWSQVCSEADSCLGLHCAFREECFVLRARREAAAADIIVTNHHLLFSDLAVRLSGMGYASSAVLPPFRRVIFDEAHHIESSATSFFSESYSRFSLMKYLGRLSRSRRGRRRGLLHALLALLPPEERAQASRLPELTDALRDQAQIFDALCLSVLGETGESLVGGGEEDFRLSEILSSLGELEGALLTYCHRLSGLIDAAAEGDEEEGDIPFACRLVLRRLEGIASVLERFGRVDEHPEEIFWAQRVRGFRGDSACRLVISPLSVAPIMERAVFGRYPFMTFTSATLAVGGSFLYWKSRIGLTDDVLETAFPSPFDYRRNVLLGVPTDAPMPTEEGYAAFVHTFVREVLRISEGRALVLFTAYSMLNEAYREIQPVLSAEGIHVFRQGEDDRHRLLTRFRNDRASVLFATSSFWEGVDTPGEALEVLIVCRLPFRVPSEPIFRARTEDIEKRGGNSFLELALPDAAIRLKQGFGRLMRRRSDVGVVLILDSRVAKRRYGRHLLDSLPPAARKITESRYLLEAVESFLIEKRPQR